MNRNAMIRAIMEARAAAIERGIEANTIVINKRLCYVKPFACADRVLNDVRQFPPMIMGMEIRFSRLPRRCSFIVCHADVTERARMETQIRMRAVREFAARLKKAIDNNQDRFINQEIDVDPYGVTKEQIDELYNELYGSTYDEL